MSASSGGMAGQATAKWLTIVGIGEDGVAGLGEAAKKAIADARFVFGGARHLELAATLVRGEARRWPSPFDTRPVHALRGQAVCVLASGDPMNHGVGATLARELDAEEMRVLPAPSAFSLAAARMGWPLQGVEAISLHGRPVALLRPLLQPGRRIVALTSDGDAPAAIVAWLNDLGFGRSRIHVLEALGGPGERVSSDAASALTGRSFAALNVVAIEVTAEPGTPIIPLGFGLDDALFEHDGQITKREIRAMTLAALSPRHGETLWDIGAGSGSISIEWMLAHPSMRAIAVEADAGRARRIASNAQALGVPGLQIVAGAAPAALDGLAPPDAVFVGGGGSGDGVMDATVAAIRPGGRLVANAVTIEMETVLAGLQERLGGALTRVAVSRAGPIGGMTGWRPAMPVTQWSWVKP
jgi:precorrin-6Y C5,15-methyltransferase (decarboxylating)